jgi:phage-related baseplate assembly protein
VSRFAIDISRLPFPGVIEPLDYEAMLAAMKADLQARFPFDDVESAPMVMLLQTIAYHRLMDRARVNDAAKAVFVAHATGADLENLAAFYGVFRRVLTPGDPTATPPVPPTLETDDFLRQRTLLGLEGQSTAGPRGAYLFHALAADSRVADAAVVGPDDAVTPAPPPGTVWVYVLGIGARTVPDTGTVGASATLVATVAAALNKEEVRPLCDTVLVFPATLINFTVTATLTFEEGPDRAVVLAAARAELEAYLDTRYGLGRDITRSGLQAALHRPGVHEVVLTAPANKIVVPPGHAARCIAITLTDGGVIE